MEQGRCCWSRASIPLCSRASTQLGSSLMARLLAHVLTAAPSPPLPRSSQVAHKFHRAYVVDAEGKPTSIVSSLGAAAWVVDMAGSAVPPSPWLCAAAVQCGARRCTGGRGACACAGGGVEGGRQSLALGTA